MLKVGNDCWPWNPWCLIWPRMTECEREAQRGYNEYQNIPTHSVHPRLSFQWSFWSVGVVLSDLYMATQFALLVYCMLLFEPFYGWLERRSVTPCAVQYFFSPCLVLPRGPHSCQLAVLTVTNSLSSQLSTHGSHTCQLAVLTLAQLAILIVANSRFS